MNWTLRWEADLEPAAHPALAELLAAIFPDDRGTFAGHRSWFGARPEFRIIGSRDGRMVAHLGVVRRTLRIEPGSRALPVGDVGLVGVHPDLRGTGLGAELLHTCAMHLRELTMPFGFLTTSDALVPFYRRGGWLPVTGQVVRHLETDDRPTDYDGPALYLPAAAPAAEWPSGTTIIRDAYEV